MVKRKSPIGPGATTTPPAIPAPPATPPKPPESPPPTHEDDPFLTPEEVARKIGKSGRTIRRWCDEGLMEATRVSGRGWMIRTSVVNQFLAGTNLPVREV